MATAEFITDGDFAHLGHEDLDLHDDTGFEFVTVFAAKDFDADDFTVLAVTHPL